jgi:hypothetical protein
MNRDWVCLVIHELSVRMIPFEDAFAAIEGMPLSFLDEVVISHKLISRVAHESAQLLLYVLICEFYLD